MGKIEIWRGERVIDGEIWGDMGRRRRYGEKGYIGGEGRYGDRGERGWMGKVEIWREG